ncbi:MAG: hypothetical protein IJP70_04265 [Bacteroidales bacterium]|nr:hypothetical protein [Bacteroidales bacterium]
MKKILFVLLALAIVVPCEARKKKKVEEKPAIETFEMPCSEYRSENGAIRAWAVGRSDNESTARKKAQSQASLDLAAQLQKTISATIEDYTSALGAGQDASSKQFLQEKSTILVQKTINGAVVICDKWNKDAATGQYSNYIVMELKGENYLNSLYEEMKGQNAKVDQDLLTKLFLQNIGIDKQ